jgi:hypothetical protein
MASDVKKRTCDDDAADLASNVRIRSLTGQAGGQKGQFKALTWADVPAGFAADYCNRIEAWLI